MNTDKHRSSPLLFVLLTAFCSLLTLAQANDVTRWVDPFIGTGGHGHTFPGANVPFGMVQLSPDTRTDNWDGSSGYHYSDDIIYGFSHTHLSGTGIPDYCDILLMPTVDFSEDFGSEIAYKQGTYDGSSSKFSHSDETAAPGYYSVKLDQGKLFAELTATKHVGLHRYTFSKSKNAGINVDLDWRDKLLDSDFKVIGRRIEGFRRSSSWAKDQIVYFVIEVSKPFGYGWGEGDSNGSGNSNEAVPTKKAGLKRGAFLGFNTGPNEQVLVKVAISPVSIEGARKNLAAELPGWDFDKVRADTKAAWNKELSKIEVSGGTDEQTKTFYTALYHTMIQPNIFSDVDGSYRGHDGKIHNVKDPLPKTWPPGNPHSWQAYNAGTAGAEEYTVFSLWDTFRAAHPLYTIIDQKRTAAFINTFIRQYEQGGRLPVWELAGNETDCMIGYHAVSVIADAMAKGIKGFDYIKAYEAAKHSAELDRDGLVAYKKRGYISSEDENESASKTLEYAYDDWCIARMATIMNQRYEAWLQTVNKVFESAEPERQYYEDYKKYSARARSFENLFDPATGFMRPKRNGGFITPFAPNEVTFNFTEGNSWVYSFFVPQDVIRLMALQGGPDKFAAKLDELFTTSDKLAGRDQPDITGLIGQYAHGNEPSHHIAYLYDYAGQPWKTQELVRKIMDEFYKPAPDGLIGNEDCGQMSAWYVMSALGLYEVAPGDPTYALGAPLFKDAKVRLENGKVFTVKAPNVSAINRYVRSIKVNRRPLDRAFLSHNELINGAVLEFEMSDKPDKNAMAVPVKHGDVLGEHESFVAVPIIGGEHVFKKETKVVLSAIGENVKIIWTTDPTEPTSTWGTYSEPITVTDSVKLQAYAINSSDDWSQLVEATFYKRPNDWTVRIDSKYNRQYTGGGDEGLIDGIRGSMNFASGEWQGYQGQDFVATVDLQKETQILTLGGGFLQNARSWIWMPTHVEFELSSDGVDFQKVADIKTDVDPTDMEPKIRDYSMPLKPRDARYVRIHAYNLGKIPAWHPGAGDDAFIFVDEILVNSGIQQ